MRDILIQRAEEAMVFPFYASCSVLSALPICNYRPRKTGKSTHLANIELQALEGRIRETLGGLRTLKFLLRTGAG